MSWALERPDGTMAGTRRPGTRTTVRAVRPWVSGAAGLLIALVGAWAAIAPFVGPEFGYRVTSLSAWHWSMRNWMLHLAPGGAALLAGLLLMSRARASRTLSLVLGLAVVAAGAWLIVGPPVWTWIEHSASYGAASARTAVLYQVGAALGPGILLAALGAVVLERPTVAVTRTVREPAPGPTTGTYPPVPGDGTPAAATWPTTPADQPAPPPPVE